MHISVYIMYELKGRYKVKIIIIILLIIYEVTSCVLVILYFTFFYKG